MIKKIIKPGLIIVAILISLLIFPGIVRAEPNFEDFTKAIENGKINAEKMGYYDIFTSLATMVRSIGGDLTETTESEDSPTGALQFTSGAISQIYSTPPASGVYYAYDVLQNLGAKTAYAQGTGFTGLQPILPIWKTFRNVTYVLFSLVFIGLGLAIMLRVKISPQAVITINNALPKVIGALILVTFSYAIAGFMIDFMYILIGLGVNILKAGGANPKFLNLGVIKFGEFTVEKFAQHGFWSLIPAFNPVKIGTVVLGSLVGSALGGLVSLGAAPGTAGLSVIAGTVGGLGIGAVLTILILFIVYLFLFLKLLFGLIKTYITIILLVILSPFQIMLGAIPGIQAGGFGKWFKRLMAEITVFPAVAVVTIIGFFIKQEVAHTSMWVAPMIGIAPGGAIGSKINSYFIPAIIGSGFLLILPQIPDLVRKAFDVESMGLGSMIGKNLQPGIGVVSWPVKQTVGRYREARDKVAVNRMMQTMEKENTPLVGDIKAVGSGLARPFRKIAGLFKNNSGGSDSGRGNS